MQVHCAFCDGVLEAAAEDLGQQISCPHCTLDFELTAALIAEEETAAGSVIGSWFNGSLSTIISAAIHTVILVLCALYSLPQQVNESVGNEVALEGLPVQQTLTTSTEPEQLEAESAEAESDSESLSELEVEIVSTTDSSDASGDLGVEALTTSSPSGSSGNSLSSFANSDGTGSASAARSGPGDAFDAKVKAAGGKTGDVQISLEWSNGNDLDLWLICPSGERIYFRHKFSVCLGNLDVDMNAGGVDTLTPVENVFWPSRKAPRGQYKVLVHHYRQQGFPDPSRFRVRVKNGGRVNDFNGSVSSGQPAVTVHTFYYRGRR